ncbi:hypothetical protein [Yeosuana marina]|uniref:hypothetical protein n=1 Tax=Yeosuana marina TaxID=1565536 RepID=UPI0030C7E4C9
MKLIVLFCSILLFISIILLSSRDAAKEYIELSKATILITPSLEAKFQETVMGVFKEEVEKRTGIELLQSSDWNSKTLIVLALSKDVVLKEQSLPAHSKEKSECKKEGYRVLHQTIKGKDVLWIIGADFRGILYGIGKTLRIAEMSKGKIRIATKIDIAESPKYEIRGHQFGYREKANSWDSWTVEQFDQHFREQVLFGANSFENIPFQENKPSVHFKYDPRMMEVEMSKICATYDADYWVWTPAIKDLTKPGNYKEALEEQEDLYARCPKLDGVFVPGGDPGKNHPSVLIPYLEDLLKIIHKYHPKAGLWVSLQGFNEEKINYFFKYVRENKPDWLTGLVNGPGSPPLDIERAMLPEKYQYRFYPDITHTIRCQYPVANWDQGFALTLGREPCNPQPVDYAKFFRRDMVFTDGFITYSDGSHDDVNKVIWSQLGWDPNKDIKTILEEYTRFYFGYKVAKISTLGILDLEENWRGSLRYNRSIKKTLALWEKLEEENSGLNKHNWRWQQLVMRAYYDAYIQERLIYEQNLEKEANNILVSARKIGTYEAMNKSLEKVQMADSVFVAVNLKKKVFEYAEALFHSIGAQTSVLKYHASDAERGAILDLIDYPLNNRLWLEDEFEKIKHLKTEDEKLKKLELIRTYEAPGKGSFYDNISSVNAKHVTSRTDDAIDYLWENNGLSRKRLSTQLFQFTPELEYEGLEFNTNYIIRVTGYGEALLRANGEHLKPIKYEKEYGEFKEFYLPQALVKNGKLKITFDKPNEEHLNWRKQSRVTDVWILKQ